MPLPDDFATESLYAPEAWFVHDVELFPEEDRLVGHMDTTRLGVIQTAQRPWPDHRPHLPGAVAVQVTGTLGQLYAIYVMGLRATDGWVGYGTHIHEAKFPRIGEIGPPVQLHCHLLKKRLIRGTWFTRFRFRYVQEGLSVYESEQTAAWARGDHRGPAPER